MGRLTIREIAKMAGVSPTAVSFVLNNKDGVSEKTRKKVMEVIRYTNFKPNINSKRLFFKKSFNISVVIKHTSSPFVDLFYFEVTKGILKKSKEFGFNIVFTDIDIDGNSVTFPDIITLNDTDGIIFLQDTEKKVLNKVEEHNIPYIVVDAHSLINGVTSINADYELSAYTATRFLIDNGHTDIAFIGSSYIPEYYLQCFSGFKRALDEAKLLIPSSWIQINAQDEITSYACMENILKTDPKPSAVFCAGDIFAIGAINCSKDLGYKVPDEISFIGIDDILLSKYFEPKLTTVSLDTVKMGEIAMELIVKKINGEQVESVIIDSDNIVVRDSVRKIK